MHLITMAHYGEAQGVIETFKLKKSAPDLYESEVLVLLLTGEGPFESATKTALVLGAKKITGIINIGIAGSLNEKLPVGSFHEVRTLYLLQNNMPQFKTFQLSEKGFDCLTSFERLLDPDKVLPLKGIGHMVDREAWGTAFAAKAAGIPMRAFKYISDMAGTLGACEIIKDEAEALSFKIALELKTVLNVPLEDEEEISLPGFYFTFSMKHKYKGLLQKLMIKDDLSSLPISELRELEISPKERTKRLIDFMEDRIDPFKKTLLNETLVLKQMFNSHGVNVQIDPTWENAKLNISFEVGSDSELSEKIEALKQVSINSFSKLMCGDFNVE